jgi:hypothetical protein
MMLIHGLDTLAAGVEDESVTAAFIRQGHTLTYSSYLCDLYVNSHAPGYKSSTTWRDLVDAWTARESSSLRVVPRF